MALVENGTSTPSDFVEHLKAFLYDSTENFVKELTDFIAESKEEDDNKNSESECESEVELDYEENSSVEAVSKAPPMRQLREYSPERRSDFIAVKKPCTYFSKSGNCRFGDECRFAHILSQTRRRNVSSRVKLINLPASELNPTNLTSILSKYGSVINVTIYPEKSEALVQFATGEEASKAVEGAVNDFNEEGVVIELETLRQTPSVPNSFKSAINRTLKPHQTQPTHAPDVTDDDKLQSLIALQKQQQSLLETNLSTQQTLLTHLQSPNISESERTELLGSLGKIQESVMGVQEMLKKTTELVVETASKSKSKPLAQKHIGAAGVGYNGGSHVQVQRPFRPQMNYNARPSFGNNTFIPGRPGNNAASFNNIRPATSFNNNIRPATSYNNNFRPATSFNNNFRPVNNTFIPGRPQSSHTLDLRPTTLKLLSLKSTNFSNIHDLQRHFSPYGNIQSLIITDNGESAVIKYQKHGDAVKAMDKFGKEDGMDIELVKQ